MIIGGTRVTTRSGHRLLADHVWRGGGNEAVTTLQGEEADLEDMVAVALHAGCRYAIRHLHLSPGEPVTDAEALDLVARIGAEFGFDPGTAVVVRHRKARRVGYDLMAGTQGYGVHWHLLVPEVDPVTLRVLDSRQMYPRHERLARDAEVRLLHRPVKGRHNAAVIGALEAAGDHVAARQLREAGLDDGPPAYAAYSSRQRRRLERLHGGPRGQPLDLPALVRTLAADWASHAVDLESLGAALRRHGLRLRHPDDPLPAAEDGRAIAPAPATVAEGWVVDAWDGRGRKAYVLGAAHKLLREPRRRVVEVLRPHSQPDQLAAVPLQRPGDRTAPAAAGSSSEPPSAHAIIK